MFRGRRRGQNFGVFMLLMQLMNFGFGRIPPVTLVAILGQVAIFLGLGDLDRWFGSWKDVCISTHYIVSQKQWARLVLGTLLHADDMHLYFNMVSLLWKGVTLEKKFKSQYFAFLLGVFTVLTSLTLVGLNWILSEVMGDRSYNLQCAVGFSGMYFRQDGFYFQRWTFITNCMLRNFTAARRKMSKYTIEATVCGF